MTPAVVGFIGLGNMGSPMATRIAASGVAVVAFDAAGTAERLPAGTTAARDVADIATRADTTFVSVPDGKATLAIAHDLAAAADRRLTTVIDLSTIGPAAAEEAAALLSGVGITYADGPVSGGVAGARAGTISLMFGGPAEVLEAHRAILESFAGNVFHVGSHAGQGQAMKLLNNYLSATALAATSEALAFGEANGLDMSVMLDVLNASTGRNSATVDKFPNRVVTGAYDAGFHTRLMAKDMRLYIEMVERAGTAGSVGAAVSAVWQSADATMPGSDFTEIWKHISGKG
ncbi:MAG TPA: NAD(P)-dependent oxidoreductase [Acidimicrobiales bacterium]|nr:NAD(P)-dependent oxidoreductase [Acidimicrobiales bacterium]